MIVFAQLDYTTGERAGAGGTFQVVSLEDDDGAELTDNVDQGRHFRSIEELERELTKVLGTDVTIETVGAD